MDQCKRIETLLEAYADGELNQKKKRKVEEHVAHCPHCAALLDEYLTLNAAIASCTVKAPEGFAESVMQAIGKEQDKPEKSRGKGVRLGRVAPYIGVGMAAMLCISVLSTALVRYVTRHFDDPDFTVEQETQANGGELDAPSFEPSPVPGETEQAPTLPDSTVNEIESDENFEAESAEMPTIEETVQDTAEYATTTPVAEGTLPSDEDAGIRDDLPVQSAKPETEQAPTTPTEPEATMPEPEKSPTEDVSPETALPAPETEREDSAEKITEAATMEEQVQDAPPAYENAAQKGFFAKVWQAIATFFENLWHAISRLFGGDAS